MSKTSQTNAIAMFNITQAARNHLSQQLRTETALELRYIDSWG